MKTNQKQLYVAHPDVAHRVGFFIIYITYNVGLQYVYKTYTNTILTNNKYYIDFSRCFTFRSFPFTLFCPLQATLLNITPIHKTRYINLVKRQYSLNSTKFRYKNISFCITKSISVDQSCDVFS
jgi:hypothetical protein